MDSQEGGEYHFIVKGCSGSQVFYSFRHLYAALGRSALHVAALRGTGHPLALTTPHSWLLSRLLSSPQLCAFSGRGADAATCCSPSVQPRPWTPPTFGPKSNSSARLLVLLGALLSKLLGSDSERRWPVGWSWIEEAHGALQQTRHPEEPQQQPQQQRRRRCDARKKSQRFKSRKGNLSSPRTTSCCGFFWLLLHFKSN